MRNNVKFVSPILNAFSSIIYVTRKLSSDENKQDGNIDEQVKKIKKQESSYIGELETSMLYSKSMIGKRKISVGKVEQTNKTQYANVENNKCNRKQHERRV